MLYDFIQGHLFPLPEVLITMQSPNSQLAEAITKILLTLIFLGGVFWFVTVGATLDGGGIENFRIDWLDLVLLSFATFRLGRLIAFDRVAEPFRAPFTRTVKDLSGAGSTVVPRGKGVQRALGQLISCPICAGTWVAAGLVVLMYFFPGPTHAFLIMTAVIGGAELIHNATEAFCWTGTLNRARTGQIFNNRSEEDQNDR